MEFLVKPTDSKKEYNLTDELAFSKEQLLQKVGRDVNKSVANIVGLVSLLDDSNSKDLDFNKIRRYLSSEATNLHGMVKEICS